MFAVVARSDREVRLSQDSMIVIIVHLIFECDSISSKSGTTLTTSSTPGDQTVLSDEFDIHNTMSSGQAKCAPSHLSPQDPFTTAHKPLV